MRLKLSYWGLFILWICITGGFAVVYWFLDQFPGQGVIEPLNTAGPALLRWYDAIYFSITTGTTVGFGDIVPIGISRFFVAIQGVVSFVLLAVLVSKFASRGQEVALENIHKLSFDSSFHSIRQGLFVARKDLDVIMKKLHTPGTLLTDKDWLNIKTAFRQMQIFVQLIPNFYNTGKRAAVIDTDREMLLLDSVQRCLTRSEELLHELAVHSAHPSHSMCVKELTTLVGMVESIFTKRENKVSDIENLESFEEILTLAHALKVTCATA